MGGYLGQENSMEVRNAEFQHSELGVDPFSVATGAAGVLKKLFSGGSSCSEDQIRQREEIRQAIARYLTSSERQALVSGMESDVQPTPSDMARFYLGGRDCKHKNVTPGDQRFLDNLPAKIQQKASKVQQTQSSGGSQTTSVSPSGGSSVPATQQNNNLPAAQAASFAPAGIDGMTLLKVGGTIVAVGGASYVIWQLTQQ